MSGNRHISFAVLIVMLISPPWAHLHAQVARGATPVACNVSAATCTSTNASGDLQIAWAGRDASYTAPSLASGWTNVGTQAINGSLTADSAVRLACRVTTSANQAVNTFANASKLIIVNYTGYHAGTTATCASTILGTPSFFASVINTTPTTETFNTVTNSDSLSWDAAFGFCSGCTTGIGTAPATMSNNTSVAGPPAVGAHDKGPAAGFTTADVTLTTEGRIITAVVEIKAAQVATPSYDHDAGNYVDSTSVTISDSTSGASIVYCTDTTDTCTPATAYTSPISISTSGTYLRSQAIKTGMAPSTIKSALYTILSACVGANCPASAKNTFSFVAPQSETGNNFIATYPNAVGAGNLKWCAVSYPSDATLTITDSTESAGSWQAAVTVTSSAKPIKTALVYKANATGGATVLTFGLTSAGQFHGHCEEWYNVATSNPVDATGGQEDQWQDGSNIVLSSTAMTTNFDNDLVLYAEDGLSGPLNGYGSVESLTGFTPGSGWKMLEGDTGEERALQSFVWAGHGTITPAMVISTDNPTNGDQHNVISVAFKAQAGAGTPPPTTGVRVISLAMFQLNGNAAYKFAFPCDGNALAFGSTNITSNDNVTAISDSVNGAWTKVADSGHMPQISYKLGITPSASTVITVTHQDSATGGGQAFWCMQGLDTAATPQVVNSAADMVLTVPSNGTAIGHMPDVTPASDAGILLALLGTYTGPPRSAISPLTFDNVPYTGETDTGVTNSGDGKAHYYYSSRSPISVGYTWNTVSNGSTTTNARAILFPAPAAPTGGARKRVIVIQ